MASMLALPSPCASLCIGRSLQQLDQRITQRSFTLLSPLRKNGFAGHPIKTSTSRSIQSLCSNTRPEVETVGQQEETLQRTASADLSSPAAAAAPSSPQWVWEESDDAVKAYAVFFGWLAVGNLPQLQSLAGSADLVYFLGLAVLTTYIGAHRGLTSKSKQQLSVKEGILAPILASCSLFGLYLIIKFIPNFSLQTFLDVYFWLLGSLAIYGAAKPLLRFASGPLGKQSITWRPPKGLLIDENGEDLKEVQLAPSDAIAVTLGVGLATSELLSHHSSFTLNNMVACLVATEILALVGLRSFRTAALLLLGLLAYDVFWVFGSPTVVGENVMLEVATSDLVVGPTRLLFPRAPGGVGEAASFPFSLLGLGDIAIPGLLAALALRYDSHKFNNLQSGAAAAAAAISGALSAMQPGADGHQTSNHNAAAAAAAAGDSQVSSSTSLEQQQQVQHAEASSLTSASNGGSSSSSSGEEQQQQQQQQQQQSPLPPVSPDVLQQRPYFVRMAAAHVAGLVAAFAANSITHLGQPALLYIVPSMLVTVAGTAAVKKELGPVWKFTDVATFGVPVKGK